MIRSRPGTMAGYRALDFHGVTEALSHMESHVPELIVTDLHMPEIDGWRFCRLLRSPEFSRLSAVPIIIVSATYKGADTVRIAADLGPRRFCPLRWTCDRQGAKNFSP